MRNQKSPINEPADYHDGTLLPMDALAIRPFLLEDLADLVAEVPVDLARELARMAAWRAMGATRPPPENFRL